MINNNNNFEQHKQTFPKAVQYADEILNGDYTLESLNGQIPNSWISAVKTELESRGYLVLSENGNKENIENNIPPEKISTEIEQAKQEFINETDRAVEQVGNIGMTTNPKVIEQVKQETNFDQDISNLKNEAEKKLTNLEYIEHVNNQIKQELLSKVDTTFTKQAARDLQRSNIENYTGKQFYTLALNEYYKYLRTADYQRDSRFDFDIDTLTREPNQLIKRVADENGWHYRMAQTSTSANKAYARISLNVVGNKKLVESLDKIAYRYGIYYKTPDESGRWDERTDPVTIYINNPHLTPEFIEQLKKEVVQETSPYIRDNNGFGFYGENISAGVEYGPENSLEDIQRVKQEAKNISEEFYQAVSEYLTKEGKEKGSVGQIMTVKKIIAMFLKNGSDIPPTLKELEIIQPLNTEYENSKLTEKDNNFLKKELDIEITPEEYTQIEHNKKIKKEFYEILSHAPKISNLNIDLAPFKNYRNNKDSWEYVSNESITDYLNKKFFFNTSSIDYSDKIEVSEIHITQSEEKIKIPIDLIVSAVGFKDWKGRSTEDGIEKSNKTWSLREYGRGELPSYELIKMYAALPSELPAVDSVNMYIQPDGKVFFDNGSGDSHRIAAAVLRGQSEIEVRNIYIKKLSKNYI